MLIRFFLIKELNRYTNITLTILFDTYVIILINVTRAGKTADVNEYWLNLWSDVTRDIDSNKPIIMAYNSPSLNHAYIVLGYKTEDGIKYLYVFSNWASSPFQWLEYNQSYMDMQSVNIY